MSSASRIAVMTERYVLLHVRNPARLFEVFFWPVMELLVWGFLSVFLKEQFTTGFSLLHALLTGMIFWDALYRSQQTLSLAFMEELWTRNVLNLFIAPLRTWEWVTAAACYAFIKTFVVVLIVTGLAIAFYAYDTSVIGLAFVPFFANLLVMGWALGLGTMGLLVRWGHAAEALIWGIPFLIQPFSAIFYPLSVYPDWLKPFCLALPSTHVLEGMRKVVSGGPFPWNALAAASALNVFYLAFGGLFLAWMLSEARNSGKLAKMTA